MKLQNKIRIYELSTYEYTLIITANLDRIILKGDKEPTEQSTTFWNNITNKEDLLFFESSEKSGK